MTDPNTQPQEGAEPDADLSLVHQLRRIQEEFDCLGWQRRALHQAVGNIQSLRAHVADLRQQLADEQRQHDITRGDLVRTRLVLNEAIAAEAERCAGADISAAVTQALKRYPADEVLVALTGHFVGLTVEFARRAGLDVKRPIRIDGGAERDIRIGPSKR